MATIGDSRGPPDRATSHPYSCNTCQVAFRNNDLQKSHMKSDWHRYNLKRRVASLPPISSEVFTEKVLQARAASTAEADKAGFERSCDVCHKTYYSENSYRNHIGSQKHKERTIAAARRAGETKGTGADDAASSTDMMSSTFSLGEPASNLADEEVDEDAEDEFNQVIEGIQNTDLQDRNSPIRRPSAPHLSAAGQHKTDHPVSLSSSENQSTEATPSGTPTPSRSDAPARTLQNCLFCNYASPTLPLNVHHMERIHGMFIPEKQYLVDLDGLITALQVRVLDQHECLFCGKVKANAYAAQTHMRDTGHCKIPYTSEAEQLEIGEFYDFRSTYSDDGEDSDTDEDDGRAQKNGGGGAKLGARRSTTVQVTDGDVDMEDATRSGADDGWETDSSASSLDSADLTAVPMEQHYHQYERLDRHPHHSRDDPRAHHRMDGWHSHAHKHNHAVFYDEYELHLPSGKSVGHRSLNRYYRQNLHNHPSPAERAEQQQLAIEQAEAEAAAAEAEDADAMSIDGGGALVGAADGAESRAVVSRANGGLGMVGVTDQKKAEARRAENKGRSLKDFSSRKNEWSVNKQANHQKYYHYSIL